MDFIESEYAFRMELSSKIYAFSIKYILWLIHYPKQTNQRQN